MKQIFLSALIMMTTATVVFAGETTGEDRPKRISFTAYPIPAYEGWYSFETEIALSRHLSCAFEAKYCDDMGKFSFMGSHNKTTYFESGPGVRIYPSRVHDGLFFGFYSDYVYSRKRDKDSGAVSTYRGFSLNGWFGYKLLLGYTVLEESIGAGYVSKSRSFGFMGFGLGIGAAF